MLRVILNFLNIIYTTIYLLILQVINAYMNLIQSRAEKNKEKYPKVYCFNTFLYEQLNKKGYDSVRRWTKKVSNLLQIIYHILCKF